MLLLLPPSFAELKSTTTKTTSNIKHPPRRRYVAVAKGLKFLVDAKDAALVALADLACAKLAEALEQIEVRALTKKTIQRSTRTLRSFTCRHQRSS